MARPGITQEQVYEAASELMDEGTAPTVQSVRERIGSGSYTTITPLLNQWREEHAKSTPANVPDIPEAVQAAFGKVWRTASLSAQAELDTERKALEAMRREMEREQADMAAEIDRLERALEEATQSGERIAQELKEAREAGAGKDERITALTVENARLDERLKASEARGGELKDQLAQLQETFAAASNAIKSKASRRDEPKSRAGGEPIPEA